MSELDRLLEEVRDLEPEDLPHDEVRKAVRRAAMTGRARHGAWVRRRVLWAAGTGAALAAAAVLLFLHAPAPTHPAPDRVAQGSAPSAAPAPERTDLELPTGDRLLAAEGARFRVELATESERRIRLDSGSMLFDVRPLDGGRFRVSTPRAEVTVLGTVFTVTSDRDGTLVRVYEGRVEVRDDSGVQEVRAGQSARVGVTDDPLDVDPLATEARRAAGRRGPIARAPRPTPAAEPSPSRPARRPRRAPSPEAPAVDEAGSEPAAEALDPARPATPDDVRGWIVAGFAARALDEARDHVSAGDLDPWLMLQADAERALGRHVAAAETYARAARALPSPRAEQAGFASARLSRSPTLALRALEIGRVTAVGSPLRERGLAMRADLLGRLGRRAERARTAREYLASYPDGSRAADMRSLVGDSQHP